MGYPGSGKGFSLNVSIRSMSLLLQLQFPEIVVRPTVGEIDDDARCCDQFGGAQTIQKDLTLQISFSNVSKRESKRMFHEECPRWLHQRSDLLHQGK